MYVFTWVLLSALKHTDGIVAEVEGDDEHSLSVHWIAGHRLGTEIQNIAF